MTSIENEITSFEQFGLPPFLHEGLQRLGFSQPTKIQAQAIPALMAGQDLVAQSQTGSGKTAAFAIPVLARVQRQARELQALVLVPTRELALQVTHVFKSLAGNAIRVTPIYGGVGMQGQIKGLKQGGYQIVVGTPGRLRDHLNRGTLQLDRIRMLVLDEADEMLDRGFAQDVEAIIQAMPENSKRQTALFSATVPDWVEKTAKKYLRPDRAMVKLESNTNNRPAIEHLVYDMHPADKNVALRHLLDNEATDSVLVFARTKHGVKKLAAKLQEEGYTAAGLQGNLSQPAREQVVAAFRSNKVRVMVATNVGARGLDISGIGHVINFDLPESAELFTHRVGRTARNGASGTAITFLTGEDRAKWREIERTLATDGVRLERKSWQGPRASREIEPVISEPAQRGEQPQRNGFSQPRDEQRTYKRSSQPRDGQRQNNQPRDGQRGRQQQQSGNTNARPAARSNYR